MNLSSLEKKYKRFETSFKEIYAHLSQTERLVAHVLFIVMLASGLTSLALLNSNYLVTNPRTGGILTEGIVGVPRFINPLYAERDVDRDLTSLVYSGLTRRTPQGNLIPDLAESWEISEDGLVYTFVLREDAKFHDGTPLDAQDIVFTVESIQESSTKSPFERDWDGIAVQALNNTTITFSLPKPFTPFIQNTTLGILPQHLWQDVGKENYLFSRYNLTPVGSGPYQVVSTKRSLEETSQYTLRSFPEYLLGTPYIETLSLLFYDTQKELVRAYESGIISSGQFTENESQSLILSEVFALFFNQSKNVFIQDLEIREALLALIDNKLLVDTLLPESAEELTTYIPERLIPQDHQVFENLDLEISFDEAMDTHGWAKNDSGFWAKNESELAFTIATADNQLLIQVGQYLTKLLEENGVRVTLEVYSPDDFIQQIIRPRNFEVLLFGQQINHGLDLYGFWHSSQRNDPGLNVSQYTNLDANIYLERLREGNTPEAYQESLTSFLETIEEEIPAIPLFARKIPYTLPEDLYANVPNLLVNPSERFNALYQWHKEKDSLWSFFK